LEERKRGSFDEKRRGGQKRDGMDSGTGPWREVNKGWNGKVCCHTGPNKVRKQTGSSPSDVHSVYRET